MRARTYAILGVFLFFGFSIAFQLYRLVPPVSFLLLLAGVTLGGILIIVAGREKKPTEAQTESDTKVYAPPIIEPPSSQPKAIRVRFERHQTLEGDIPVENLKIVEQEDTRIEIKKEQPPLKVPEPPLPPSKEPETPVQTETYPEG